MTETSKRSEEGKDGVRDGFPCDCELKEEQLRLEFFPFAVCHKVDILFERGDDRLEVTFSCLSFGSEETSSTAKCSMCKRNHLLPQFKCLHQ